MDASSSATDSVLSALKDFVNPALGLATAVAVGVITLLTTKLKTLSDEKIAAEARKREESRDTVTASVQLKEAQTREFEVLLESYQRHVDQLTAEVHALRVEVTQLRTALAARLTMCSGCDRFAEWQQNFSELTKSLEPRRGTGA